MKKNSTLFSAFLFVAVAACFFTFQITYHKTDSMWRENVDAMIRTDATRISDNISALNDSVSSSYLYNVNENTLVDGIMKGYVSGLDDKYAMYMNKRQYQDYIKSTTASTAVGIGVNLLYDSTLDGLYVVNVYNASPAQQAGIVPGDIITHINGVHVKSYGFYGAVLELGYGKTNDSIAVIFKKKNGEAVSTFISKNMVRTEGITYERLGNSIGLISIISFEEGGKAEFVQAMETLIASGCEKFVVDVRNNCGGNLETVTSILDFLLPSGTLVSVMDRAGTTNSVNSDVNESPYPVAVLVNKGTICEAEVFAAAMRKLSDAKLVGSTTYGKASRQSVVTLPDGGAVCFSTSAYVMPDGESFDKTGLTPDIAVNLSDEAVMNFTTIDKSEDAQLQEAINYLKGVKAENIKY